MKRNPVWLLATFVALSSNAAPTLEWHGDVSGGVRERVGDVSEAELILLISGEQEGRLGDCGCPYRPLGGLARIAGYAQSVRRKTGVPVVLVNTGHAFDDTIDASGGLRADVIATNALMAQALESWDVVNVGASDVPWLDAHPLSSVVSANVLPTDGRSHRSAHVVDVEGRRVAIVGISGPGLAFLPPENHRTTEPVEALRTVLSELAADAVVVVALHLNDRLLHVAELPDVDVIVSAGGIHERWAPELLGEVAWVRSITDGQVLTELRLSWPEGAEHIVVRSIDLDDALPEERTTRRLEQREARIRAGGLP